MGFCRLSYVRGMVIMKSTPRRYVLFCVLVLPRLSLLAATYES